MDSIVPIAIVLMIVYAYLMGYKDGQKGAAIGPISDNVPSRGDGVLSLPGDPAAVSQ